MSNPRTRGSASKEVAENDEEAQASVGGIDVTKDVTFTAEPEEEEDGEDNSGSGESSNSTYLTANTRSKRIGSGKKKRGGAGALAASRARAGKASQSAVDEGGDEVKEEGETSAIKSEIDEEETQFDQGEDAKPASGFGENTMSRSNSKDEGKHSRQRSASGFKELAGLGLRSLGDGEEEPLVPRRTRRGAVSPQDGSTEQREDEEGNSNDHDEETKREENDIALDQDISAPAEGQTAQGEEETAEEGVTRCLCGSAGE